MNRLKMIGICLFNSCPYTGGKSGRVATLAPYMGARVASLGARVALFVPLLPQPCVPFHGMFTK